MFKLVGAALAAAMICGVVHAQEVTVTGHTQTFRVDDLDGDGALSPAELNAQAGVLGQLVRRLADTDRDGMVSQEELLGAEKKGHVTIPLPLAMSQATLHFAEPMNRQTDVNGDGVLSPAELQAVRAQMPEFLRPVFDRTIVQLDKDHDGALSGAEYAANVVVAGK